MESHRKDSGLSDAAVLGGNEAAAILLRRAMQEESLEEHRRATLAEAVGRVTKNNTTVFTVDL